MPAKHTFLAAGLAAAMLLPAPLSAASALTSDYWYAWVLRGDGVLALQLHAGKPMWAEYRNIRFSSR